MNKKFLKKALLLGVSAAALAATNLNADMHENQNNGQNNSHEMMEHDMMKHDNNNHNSSEEQNSDMQ